MESNGAAAGSVQQLNHASDVFQCSQLSEVDDVLVRQIKETHAALNGQQVDVRSLLFYVEELFGSSISLNRTDTQAQMNYLAGVGAMINALWSTFNQISSEMESHAVGTDPRPTTISVLRKLSFYNWEAKLVLTLTAFSLNPKVMNLLHQSNDVQTETAPPPQSWFDALNNLISVILKVTRSVVSLRFILEAPPIINLTSRDSLATDHTPAATSRNSLAIDRTPTATYLIIRSIVTCATQVFRMDYKSVELDKEAEKLSNLAQDLQYIEEWDNKYFQMLVDLFKKIHIDNMEILKALIYTRNDPLPLFDCSTKKRVNIDVLKSKNVLLLISDLEISQLSYLEQIYDNTRSTNAGSDQYEFLWLPVLDKCIWWNEIVRYNFETLTLQFFGKACYIVHNLPLIEPSVNKFIREKWNFSNKPLLVVLDPQGRVVSPNAIHMIWIWGTNAFPFTSLREEALWRQQIWGLRLLVDDPTILEWIKEGKYIYLFGGDDIEWIRKFSNQVRTVAMATHIPVETVYVGLSTVSKREQVQRVINTITSEKLGFCLQEQSRWMFWTRLESMLSSKIQMGEDEEKDLVLREIRKLLRYRRWGEWAMLCKGSHVVVLEHGKKMLRTLLEYDEWKENVILHGFDMAFKKYRPFLDDDVSDPSCYRFDFLHTSSSDRKIPERMKCPKCRRYMEKYTTFLCC